MPWLNNATITKAGPAENGVIYIALRPSDGSWHRWFEANSSIEKELLATALTAVGTGKKAQVAVTGTTQYSTINRLYVYT